MTNIDDIRGLDVAAAKSRLTADRLVEIVAHHRSGDVQRAARRLLDATGYIWAGCRTLDESAARAIMEAFADLLWTDGRPMSFALTTTQLLDGTKSVTRRNGWAGLKAGARVRAVRKGQGLKKGERLDVFGIIEIVSARRERLDAITPEDVVREGFPEMTPTEFVAMFCKHMKGTQPETLVTRIEFRLVHRFAGPAR